MDKTQDAGGGGALVPSTGTMAAATGSQPSTAGTNPTPMSVDEGFFTQPVQAYFQFVQNNLTYINEGNIDAFQQLYQEFEGVLLVKLPSNVQKQTVDMST